MSEGLGLGLVEDCFNVVTVRVNDEGGVVATVVLRPQTRRTVVPAPGGQGCTVERLDFLPTACREGQVKMGWELRRLVQAQRRSASAHDLHAVGRVVNDLVNAERLKRRQVEGSACGVVCDAELYVVEHAGQDTSGVLAEDTPQRPFRGLTLALTGALQTGAAFARQLQRP